MGRSKLCHSRMALYLARTNRLSQGDVVAQPRDYPNGASGHVMIVGPNNTFMGVGPPERQGRSPKD